MIPTDQALLLFSVSSQHEVGAAGRLAAHGGCGEYLCAHCCRGCTNGTGMVWLWKQRSRFTTGFCCFWMAVSWCTASLPSSCTWVTAAHSELSPSPCSVGPSLVLPWGVLALPDPVSGSKLLSCTGNAAGAQLQASWLCLHLDSVAATRWVAHQKQDQWALSSSSRVSLGESCQASCLWHPWDVRLKGGGRGAEVV